VEVRAEAVIVNRAGLHARPCHALVQAALEGSSRVVVRCEGREADGRSILSMMTLQAGFGNRLEFEAHGEDAEAVVARLVGLVAAGFDEPG